MALSKWSCSDHQDMGTAWTSALPSQPLPRGLVGIRWRTPLCFLLRGQVDSMCQPSHGSPRPDLRDVPPHPRLFASRRLALATAWWTQRGSVRSMAANHCREEGEKKKKKQPTSRLDHCGSFVSVMARFGTWTEDRPGKMDAHLRGSSVPWSCIAPTSHGTTLASGERERDLRAQMCRATKPPRADWSVSRLQALVCLLVGYDELLARCWPGG